ncbi:tumor necrosis factor receptor superfamily member 10B-like isoform X2 [Nerophis lumbriciformis]|uniref:tumor necrosis factor receptor superfamily member 10B-like isoform X2 n=1 Tax=Nerophis lumbriciformis TaxID=546530 RepID=UPI002ADFE29E|nr:tumor necrosis factor receptor superfamily member 10A-like isoform X2 [Nerophis lumbriciformis]
MTTFLPFTVFFVLICSFASSATFSQAGSVIRTRLEAVCGDEEYLSNNICCLKCPAGTHVKSHCTTAHEKGQCEQCDHKTFTEHANDLEKCITCPPCRSDQEIMRPCSPTQNIECRCKEGTFCAPEEACEVCKKCSRCEEDDKVVRNCTATSNTECKKTPLQSDPPSKHVLYVILATIAVGPALVFGGVCMYLYKKSPRSADTLENLEKDRPTSSHPNQNVRCPSLHFFQSAVRSPQPAVVVDECQHLCESITSSASNSQQNLTMVHKADEPFPKVMPVNGVQSLLKCFPYFEDVDCDYHSKFFRHLCMNDNVIKSKIHLPYDDRIHELLNIWLEREGKEASLNELLSALLECDQKQTAEMIKKKALEEGHYILENK